MGVRLTRDFPASSFMGLKIRIPDRLDPVVGRNDVSVLLHCYSLSDRSPSREIVNLTDQCSEFSIYTTAPIIAEIPYRVGTEQEINEAAISVFGSRRTYASAEQIRPIESYVD